MENEEKLRIVNQYIGFGNPLSEIWFFGSEERCEWDENSIEKFKNISVINGVLDRTTTTYGGYARILEYLFPENLINNNYFISNLWPIGKDNINMNFIQRTVELFGFPENDTLENIIDIILKDRFFALELFFKLFNWKSKVIFFCVGNENSDYLNQFIRKLTHNQNLIFQNIECNTVSTLTGYKRIFQPYHGRSININFVESMNFIKNKLS